MDVLETPNSRQSASGFAKGSVRAGDQLLVGSVPFGSAREVFTVCSEYFDGNLRCLSDGEFGDRIWWHNFLARFVFHGHPDIETVQRPAPVNGYPNWKPRDLKDMWHFKLRAGVRAIKLDELGYAKHAIHSYETFALLKEMGRVPRERRFQVNLPLTSSAIGVFFNDSRDFAIMAAAYEDAARREVASMLEVIPAHDLVILWDVCVEILDLEGALPWMPKTGAMERSAAAAENIVAHVPRDVATGFHLCYGTLPRWPMTELKSIHTQVTLANELTRRSGRPVELLHLVLPKEPTAAFFEGALDLQLGGANLYLGLIHDDDTLADNIARVRLAEKYLPSFGTAYVCGFGRRSREDSLKLLARHRELAHALA